MKLVGKYLIGRALPGTSITIKIPEGAWFCKAGMQGENVVLWFEIDTLHESIERTFLVLGTGQEIPDGWVDHLATVFDSPFVWHIYEEREL